MIFEQCHIILPANSAIRRYYLSVIHQPLPCSSPLNLGSSEPSYDLNPLFQPGWVVLLFIGPILSYFTSESLVNPEARTPFIVLLTHFPCMFYKSLCFMATSTSHCTWYVFHKYLLNECQFFLYIILKRFNRRINCLRHYARCPTEIIS